MTEDRPARGDAARNDGVRLQKVLAQAGVASRRAAEELIAAGRVSVDGKVVREMGRRVDPETAVVHVDGNRIVLGEDLVHLALNKPIYARTAAYGHFGRPPEPDGGFSWEKTDLIEPLVAELQTRGYNFVRIDELLTLE